MTILHLINHTPDSPSLRHCLAVLEPTDRLLLLEDGVYAALLSAHSPLSTSAAAQHVYALEPDLRARGIAALPLLPRLKQIDYGDFVALVIACDKTLSWRG